MLHTDLDPKFCMGSRELEQLQRGGMHFCEGLGSSVMNRMGMLLVGHVALRFAGLAKCKTNCMHLGLCCHTDW